MRRLRPAPRRAVLHRGTVLASLMLALACAACGAGGASTTPSRDRAASQTPTTAGGATGAAGTTALPGIGRPQVTIGDKNYTEQEVLGQLYALALKAQGYTVQLNQNIGPPSVTMQNLRTGALDMYPEYLNTFNATVAGDTRRYGNELAAYAAAQRYAGTQGLSLLTATPFSDSDALAVTVGYAQGNHTSTLRDLARVQDSMVVGGPPQFQQLSPGLSDLEHRYHFSVHTYKSLGVGDQYAALNEGTIQVAWVKTTDGQLTSGDYALLADPHNTFGYGNAMPVVSQKALAAEGPAFGVTIDRISALLSTDVIRQLNSAVDVAGQDPATVARTFLETHGVIAPGS